MTDTKAKNPAPLILAVITARGGSKGLPGKNIKALGGKPLIAYSVIAAAKSSLITHSIVSTDDPAIADAAREYGADAPFMRPPELALDTTPHIPVMQHAVSFMEGKLGIRFDYVVILQPTSPFRTPDDIDQTLRLLMKTGADSAVTMVEVEFHEHPIKMKKLEGDRVVPYSVPEPERGNRHNLAPAYKRSAAVYAMKRDLLMQDGLLFGNQVVGHIVPKDRSIDIDTQFDWLKAEHMLEDLKRKGYDW